MGGTEGQPARRDRNVPIDERMPDLDLVNLSKRKSRKHKYVTAPYCFDRRGLWYKEYWRLADLKDSTDT